MRQIEVDLSPGYCASLTDGDLDSNAARSFGCKSRSKNAILLAVRICDSQLEPSRKKDAIGLIVHNMACSGVTPHLVKCVGSPLARTLPKPFSLPF